MASCLRLRCMIFWCNTRLRGQLRGHYRGRRGHNWGDWERICPVHKGVWGDTRETGIESLEFKRRRGAQLRGGGTSDVFWNHLKSWKQNEINWNHLAWFEIAWNGLKMAWDHQGPNTRDIIWNHLKSFGMIWHHLNTFDLIWGQMVSNDFTWSQMIPNHLKWLRMISSRFNVFLVSELFHMISNDANAFQTISNAVQWF